MVALSEAGLTLAEIAKVMGVTTSAVTQSLAREGTRIKTIRRAYTTEQDGEIIGLVNWLADRMGRKPSQIASRIDQLRQQNKLYPKKA